MPSNDTRAAAYLGDLAPFLGNLLTEAVGPRARRLTILGSGDEVPPDAEVLATMASERSVISKLLLPDLKWIHVLGTGVDEFPLDLVGDRVLTCSRGASAVAIAEWVLASMLAFEKQLPQVWLHEPPARWGLALLGGLSGRTLGLVGLGAIGTEVAKRALAFDMSVIGYRRTASPGPDGVEVVSDISALYERSDHVVLALRATRDTRNLIDNAAFAAMRRGVHVVNVARGELVDQDALLRALDDGTVALASLDVAHPEPLPAGHPFYTHPKVHLSAHVSWSGPITLRLTIDMFADNLKRYGDGAPLTGVVDVAAGY